MPTRIQYRTKLVGFDKDWVERGPQHIAEYTNLTPGHYRFLVSAAYPDGDWSVSPAALELEILPFFWQRTSFLVSVAAMVLLLIIVVYRWRILSLRRNELTLRRQVLEKTSELRQQAEILTLAVEEKSILAEQLRLQAAAFAAQAREDGLTGLANRRAFDEQLASEFNRAQRLQHQLCLAIMDIDHFKRINDQWSHMAGDEVLKRIAEILKLHCRDIDLTSRWGGEEFALLLPQTSLEQGHEVCERLRLAIASADFQDIAAGLKVTASFGIAVNTGLAHYDKLISRADTLLYQAKTDGRNKVCS
jgi:diguanylate cyclase (GGDEF)-like protein